MTAIAPIAHLHLRFRFRSPIPNPNSLNPMSTILPQGIAASHSTPVSLVELTFDKYFQATPTCCAAADAGPASPLATRLHQVSTRRDHLETFWRASRRGIRAYTMRHHQGLPNRRRSFRNCRRITPSRCRGCLSQSRRPEWHIQYFAGGCPPITIHPSFSGLSATGKTPFTTDCAFRATLQM